MYNLHRRRDNDQEMQDNISSQLDGDRDQEYEDLYAFVDLKISSQPYEEIQFQPPLPNRPTVSDSQEYNYNATLAGQAAVSSHGDGSKEFGYIDCAAYNAISNYSNNSS